MIDPNADTASLAQAQAVVAILLHDVVKTHPDLSRQDAALAVALLLAQSVLEHVSGDESIAPMWDELATEAQRALAWLEQREPKNSTRH